MGTIDSANLLRISTLPHTWIIDIDGTLVKHNGYKLDGKDTLLAPSASFMQGIPAGDTVILLTSRTEGYREMTERFLQENHIRYDHIIFGAPMGERILVNDDKPSGLKMAYAITPSRDCGICTEIMIDGDL